MARSNVDRWAEWAKINVAAGFTVPIFWQMVRIPKAKRDPKVIAAAVQKLEDTLRIAEDVLKTREFLAGDTFSLADVQFGHVLYRYYDIAITRADLPALRQYYDRLCARGAYRDRVMVSYDALRA